MISDGNHDGTRRATVWGLTDCAVGSLEVATYKMRGKRLLTESAVSVNFDHLLDAFSRSLIRTAKSAAENIKSREQPRLAASDTNQGRIR